MRYKLRLGDGTVLSVDSDGLKTWAADTRAMVQIVGSWRWQPLQQVLAEEEAASRLQAALIPPTPKSSPAPSVEAPPPSPPVEVPPSEPPAVVSARPSLQVLADDLSPGPAPGSPDASGSTDGMPVIPLKPPDDEPVFRSAWDEGGERDEIEEEEPREGRLEGPLLRVLETLGGFLSRCLAPLTPHVRGMKLPSFRWPARKPVGQEPQAPSRAAAAPPAPAPVVPVAEDIGFAPEPRGERDEEARPDSAGHPGLLARVSARVSAWVGSLSVPGPPPADWPEEPTPEAPPPPKAEAPLPSRPVQVPPPPIAELPALPLAPSREPRRSADVWEGDEYEEEGPSFSLEPVWRWTKRIVVVGALAALVGYAVLERDTWIPGAAQVGQTVFTEIDRQVHSRERSEEQRKALEDAAVNLPGLAPETIRLFFSRSPAGIVEPPEVFQLAREATDRGRTALTVAEAAELRALERELLAGLSAPQRARVREYDRTRGRRVIFPFENPHIMDLVALGVRQLPPERLERLQALTHRAVVAGLDAPAAADGPGAAR